jgi:acetyltransferase-like isoleucine patch superfamily enzyme
MTISSFLDDRDLLTIGFKSVGQNCKISKHACIYSAGLISIGNNCRIDDFCILSPSGMGGLLIGNNVHIAPYCLVSGRSIIRIGDYVNISSRVSIYSSSDDFSGEELPGPQSLLDTYQPYESSPISIGSFSIIGAASVLLPGAELEEGASVGALSLVKDRIPAFSIYGGIPAKYIRSRSKNFVKHLYG